MTARITINDSHPHVERHLRRIERELIAALKEQKNAIDTRRIIRDKALEVERIGAGYACNFFGVDLFYAAEDFAQVGRAVDDFYRILVHNNSSGNSSLNLDSAAITLTSVMLARATVSKSRQIFHKLQSLRYEYQTAAIMRMKSLKETLDVPDEEDPDAPTLDDLTPDAPETSLWYVWRTVGDDKVCDICEPLDEMEWDFEDPAVDADMLTPVLDTHINCRCRIDLERRDEGS